MSEMAITFMLLVLLLSVSVDLGRAYFSYIAVREATEEGALYGSINPEDTGGIIARVRTSSSTPVDLADTSFVQVVRSFPGGGQCAGNTLQVTVTYDFYLITPIISSIIGVDHFPISLTASSTILRPEC